jgi:hypothetical protein
MKCVLYPKLSCGRVDLEPMTQETRMLQSQLREIVSPEIVDRVLSATRRLSIASNYSRVKVPAIATEAGVSEEVISEVFGDEFNLTEEAFEESWAVVCKLTIDLPEAATPSNPLKALLGLIRTTLSLYDKDGGDYKDRVLFAFGTYQYMWDVGNVSSQMADSETRYMFKTLQPLAEKAREHLDLKLPMDSLALVFFLMSSMGRTLQAWNWSEVNRKGRWPMPDGYIDALKLILFNKPGLY